MTIVTIQSKANQIVEFTGDDNEFYLIHLYSYNGLTFADVMKNNKVLVYGVLCVPDQNIIPYGVESKRGNFKFVCVEDEYPYYTLFNKTQQLYYLSEEELA